MGEGPAKMGKSSSGGVDNRQNSRALDSNNIECPHF
ncbi:hypothetical protein COLO4_22221 [Corchorus olitorius]|uniref:Uncharacterized protein n=1 Tax=Corchorus olitorius TaxID=93759 RepID=A0A1R3INH4_9ROSI|nr:hypothetical protein COLO4_22221 [Corchorus olitorius]